MRYLKQHVLSIFHVCVTIFFVGVVFFGMGQATVSPGETGFGSAKVVIDANIGIAGTDQLQEEGLEDIIKGVVNRVLGILALIAVLMLLWGGFQMVTAAGNEEQYNGGFGYIKNAAIGLAIIGIAWFIVSIMFFVLNLVTESSVGVGADTDT